MLAQAALVVVRDWWLARDSKFKPGKAFDIISIGSSPHESAAKGSSSQLRPEISRERFHSGRTYFEKNNLDGAKKCEALHGTARLSLNMILREREQQCR